MIEPSVLRAMLAAGATAEMIVSVVEADYEAEAAKKAVKRAQDAERQRRNRHAESRDVTECPRDMMESRLVTDGEKVPPHPPIKTITPRETKVSLPPPPSKTNRGTRLSQDWSPPEPLWQKAVADLGLAEDVLRFETSAFRDHFVAKTGTGATKLDWGRAWMNWMREALRRRSRGQGGLPLGKAGVQRNGTGWHITHGTEEYAAWRKYAHAIDDGDLIYALKDQPGHTAKVPDRWPPRRAP